MTDNGKDVTPVPQPPLGFVIPALGISAEYRDHTDLILVSAIEPAKLGRDNAKVILDKLLTALLSSMATSLPAPGPKIVAEKPPARQRR